MDAFMVIAVVVLTIACSLLAWRWTEARVRASTAETSAADRKDIIAQRDVRIGELGDQLKMAEEGTRQKDIEIAQLKATLENQADRFKEQSKFEGRMKEAVESLAQKALRQESDRIKEINKEEMNHLLNPFKQDLKGFKESVEKFQIESTKDRAIMQTQFSELKQATTAISRDANDLTRALKGDKQKQGAWGEKVLETVLENSGLKEGREYHRQETIIGDEGDRLRPDVIVDMPNSEERVIIDSKVSLNAFIEYVNLDDEEACKQALQSHLQAVRGHITKLSERRYPDAARSNLDFAIMFMPIEASFAVIMEEDMEITEYAIKKNIILATPTTLLLALRTIANLWRVERRNINAEKIASRGGILYDKISRFLEIFSKIGERFDSTRKAYDDASNLLKYGRGNIVRQTEMLRDLGVNPSKQIPDNWRENDSEDDEVPSLEPQEEERPQE